MTTGPVVFVDASLSVRCSSNHSAIKICSMLFVSQWERLYETCTRAKGDIYFVSGRRRISPRFKSYCGHRPIVKSRRSGG